MVTLTITKHPGDANFYASNKGVVKASSSSSAAAAVIAIARLYPRGTVIYVPSQMPGPMKAGDIISRADLNATAAPAYASAIG
jgi:hypothetical protein